jgi:hypothetical protein
MRVLRRWYRDCHGREHWATHTTDRIGESPCRALAVIIVRHKQTGDTVKYTVADSWLPKLAEWNRTLDAHGQYDAVMKADGLFDVTPMK